MYLRKMRRWFFILATGMCLASNCVTLKDIRDEVSSGLQGTLTDVLGLYVTAAVDSFFQR
ncbi:MAG: hypothetical protein GXY44_05555 [Phycisphaerales bacterium]|nr:hypothetical protein [Phycisphaerales bacterium]